MAGKLFAVGWTIMWLALPAYVAVAVWFRHKLGPGEYGTVSLLGAIPFILLAVVVMGGARTVWVYAPNATQFRSQIGRIVLGMMHSAAFLATFLLVRRPDRSSLRFLRR